MRGKEEGMRRLIGVLIVAVFFIGMIAALVVNVGLTKTLFGLGVTGLILGAFYLFALGIWLIWEYKE